MIRTVRVLTAAAVLGGVLAAVSASPASASCLPDPLPSPYAFTGRVVHTKWDGRIAHVRTDTGKHVIVRGAERRSEVTSVDRSYQVNQRYEFHPLNSGNPYRDNICTATHLL